MSVKKCPNGKTLTKSLKKTTSKLVSIQITKFEDVYMNTLRIISFRKSRYLINNFTIFESLLFEGYSCKRHQTLYTY